MGGNTERIAVRIDKHLAQVIHNKEGVDRLKDVDAVYDRCVKPWFRRERGVVNIYVYQHTRSVKLRPRQTERTDRVAPSKYHIGTS